MKKIIITLTLLGALATSAAAQKIHVYAHRGSWSKNEAGEFVIPENCPAAVAEAARRGYEGIECDVRLTKDGRMVILHDATLNRTMRNAGDYSKLQENISLDQLTSRK